ncbi:MAG: respiratory nitrate reductase subunit gamma [Deltaproteobacteria bacterium]|nr:respiratory nitrate reductase subunit gamma [Deltaproteobacteria bacterium]
MNLTNTLAFLVFPYLALTVFVVGHLYRYLTDPFAWNAHSSELLDKKGLKYGITIFHWGILLTLAGHTGGLLVPQSLYDAIGLDGQTHTTIAYYSGLLVGAAAFGGSLMLTWRRRTNQRIKVTSSVNDWCTLALLVFVTGMGLFNVIFGHFYVLDSIAPWIRGILTFRPEPALMLPVPVSYKIHILSAFVLLAFSPFSRLIHIWSAPVSYAFRRQILYRRRHLHS